MKKSIISRRKFLCTTATATAFTMVPLNYYYQGRTRPKKPNSKVGGVQIGITTYGYIHMPHSAEEVLEYVLQAGVNSIEARCFLEESLGIPYPLSLLAHPQVKLTNEQREEQKQWRLSLPMQKYADLRRMYNDAGVNIHIAKFAAQTQIQNEWSDEEVDYAFNVAKTLGAYGVSDSVSTEEDCKRFGKFAEKHNSLAIYHISRELGRENFDIKKYLAHSSANMINLDAGHYFGATGLHPNNIIERYHDRICSLHIRDKTGPKSNPPDTNVPFGEGETPIADMLLLIKKEQWPINVDVEMEYPVPEGSDAAKETTKCVEYLRAILE